MSRGTGFSDRDADRLLAGGSFDDESLGNLAELLRGARDSLSIEPDEITAARHIALMGDALRAGTREPQPLRAGAAAAIDWRRFMVRSKSFAVKLAAALVAGGMSLTGLAYAGVDLPGNAAEQALEQVLGVQLPNQHDDGSGDSDTAGKSVSDDVRSVIEGSTAEGCEFGQEVSATASANNQGEASERPEVDPCTRSDGAGEQARGSRATGEERSAEGRANADDASNRGASAGSKGGDNAGTHDDTGRAKSDGARVGNPTENDGP